MPAEFTRQHDMSFVDQTKKAADVLDHAYPTCVAELTACNGDKARIESFGQGSDK